MISLNVPLMRKIHFGKFVVSLALISASFIADLFFAWGFMAYLIVSFYLAKMTGSTRLVMRLAIVISVLIIAGYFMAVTNLQQDTLEVTNRLLLLVVAWLSAFINLRFSGSNSDRKLGELFKLTATERDQAVRKLGQITSDIETFREERKSIENELLKGKRLHDAMVHNFPDGVICVLNRELKFVLAEGKGLKELGLHGAELRGEQAVIGSGEELKLAFAGESVSFETTINHQPYTVKAVPIPDANNEVKEILIVIRNITDRKRMENNLVKALEKEKELSLLKSQFVTMASHKFRTPLSTILSSVFLLENNIEADDQERKSYFEKIKRSVHNLTELLNDFLSLGKLEEGKVKVAYSETNVKAFFEEFLEAIGLIKKGKQEILFTYGGVANTIMTDQVLLKSILMSLLSNAIEYSAYDAEIRLDVELSKDNLKIQVSDQGIGIPKDEQHQIFKGFYRGQNTNNVEGTGLGLNMANKYIRLLKGTIDFTSQVNKGTTFIAKIPVVTLDILEKQI